MKETIGCYAFVTKNWQELAYPLDLWLKHHVEVFDQISLVTYGEFDLPFKNHKIKVYSMDEPNSNKNDWYIIGKQEAQTRCNTDWKILLDIDEFINEISLTNYRRDIVYPLIYNHLYGSLEYKIEYAFPRAQWRIHTNNGKIVGDGANVESTMSMPISYFYPRVWHTNACRTPTALSNKWAQQNARAVNSNSIEGIVKPIKNNDTFNYSEWQSIWRTAKLVKVNQDKVPKILLENADRFTWWTP